MATPNLDGQTPYTPDTDHDVVLYAMRLAERLHRDQRRKAPADEDRPAYFLHLSEAAWLVQKAGASETLVAAAYLHDTIEDCGLTEPELAAMTTPEVAALVNWVSEPGRNHSDWHDRNAAYRRRMESAPPEALTLSCADKTANMLDMLRLLDKGHQASDFLSVGIEHQVRKFRALGILFQPRVPRPLLACFHSALRRLAAHAG